MQKVDGIFKYTTLEIDKNNPKVKVIRSRPNYQSLTDENRDELVDIVYFKDPLLKRGSHSRTYYRDKDLLDFPNIFKNADRDFKNQIKRFKQYQINK